MTRRMGADERLEAVRAMTLNGISARTIAERLEISTRHVRRLRVATGVSQSERARMTDEQIAKAAELIDGGCSLAEAARSVGVSAKCVQDHFPGRGWTREQVREYARFMQRQYGGSKRPRFERTTTKENTT